MRSRILVIPAVGDLDSFSRLAAHIGHYFGHVDAERIVVLVEPNVLPEAKAWLASPSPPPGFGNGIVGRVAAVRTRFELRPWPADLERLSLTSDLVLDWDIQRSAVEPWASVKSQYRMDRTLFSIDWKGVRMGAARLADAARLVTKGRSFDRSQAEAVANLGRRLRPAARAYLVATGPSARRALDRDLSDGIRIVCNTVILDHELMEHVRPQVLTFADPIFHFGPSTYAQRFQEAVVEQARKHDFSIVTTERFAPLLRAHLPEVADRVIGLRQGTNKWPDNFDLLSHPAVRPYPNVLTMLMLPIAASMTRSIGLIGFDGRDPDEDYFWRHGSTVQFDEELRDIRVVHPGFFELDYSDYYDDHVATVDRLLASLELRGAEILPMADSHIPALRRRTLAPVAASPIETSESRQVLVSLTPDWIGDFGHFGPFERRVHEVAEARGDLHLALTSLGLKPSAAWQVPTFSEASLPSDGRFAPVGLRFEQELRAALAQLRLARGAVVFQYTADVWHLAATLAVAVEHPETRFVVNLMRSHGWLDQALDSPDPWVDSLVDLLRTCLVVAAQINVAVAVDTEALARDVELLTGTSVLVWPMIAVSVPPKGRAEATAADGPPHVVAPVQAQGGKGFPELVALAERFSERLARGELRLTARWPTSGMQAEMVRLAERFEAHGGRLVRDNLSDEAFVDLVAAADVALIPYRVRPFRTRTSAVTVDALLAGKPVVAVRGTWAGNLIDRYGAGQTYPDGDITAMDRAVSQVIADNDTYRRRVAEIRGAVEAEHSPHRLIEFLEQAPNSTTATSHARGEIDGLGERLWQMRRLYQWHVTSEDATRMNAVIREDDQQRSIDTLRDQVDSLKRSAAYRGASGRGGRLGRLSRRAGVRQAMTGAFRVSLVAAGVLGALGGGLALAGYGAPALLALAAAVSAVAMASLVVAVRLERRR